MKAIYVARDGAPALSARAVRQVMSAPAICVAADATLGDALRAMVRGKRRHLVVVDSDGTCRGILADRTIVAVWARRPEALDTDTVASALAPGVAMVDERATVAAAARLMRADGVDAVAVLDADHRPVGIVTGSDLVALLAG